MHFLINGEMVNENFIDKVTSGFLQHGIRNPEYFIAENDWSHPQRGTVYGMPIVFLITLGDGRTTLLMNQETGNGEYECIESWIRERRGETVKYNHAYIPPPTQPKPAPLPELSEEEQYQARIKTLEKQLDF